MYAVCLRYVRRKEDARDILQEGFIHVFKDLKSYSHEGNFEGWVRKVMVRAALQFLRKRKQEGPWIDLEDKHIERSVDIDYSDMDGLTTAQVLTKLIQQMPEGFRTVLNLYIVDGYTHQQIADELGISVGTSKSQLSRAKAQLKALFENRLVQK